MRNEGLQLLKSLLHAELLTVVATIILTTGLAPHESLWTSAIAIFVGLNLFAMGWWHVFAPNPSAAQTIESKP